MNYTREELSIASSAKKETRDCSVRAITAATDFGYDDVHYVCELYGRKRRKGMSNTQILKAVDALGYDATDVTQCYEQRARTIRTLKPLVSKQRSYLVFVRGHVLCIRNGEVLDWTDNRLHRIQEVYLITEKK